MGSVISLLEESVKNVEDLNYEYVLDILNDESISKSLDNLFKDKKQVNESDLLTLTDNKNVYLIISTYLINNEINIIKNNNLAVSDLSEELILYKSEVSKYKKVSEEDIENYYEMLDKEVIIKSYLDYVFTLVLELSTDNTVFGELLSDANEELVNLVYSYDKSIHNNLKQYITFNINKLVSENIDYYLNNYESPYESLEDRNYDILYVDPNFVQAENSIILNKLIKLSNMSKLEREIIEYRYGFKDGKVWDYAEIGKQLGINKMAVMQKENIAIKKLSKNKKMV